jgi:hypothetical protein
MIDPKRIKEAEEINKKIIESIKVSQMLDIEGAKIFNDFLEKKTDEYTNVNVLVLKDMKKVDEYCGRIYMLAEINSWLSNHVSNAMRPMIDIETGEFEKINPKKNAVQNRKKRK